MPDWSRLPIRRSVGVLATLAFFISPAGPAVADPMLPTAPITIPVLPGAPGGPSTPAVVSLASPTYAASVGDNSAGTMIYTQRTGAALLAAPLSSSTTGSNGTTTNGTTLQAYPQPAATASASSTGTNGALVQGGAYGLLTSSSESVVTYHAYFQDPTQPAGSTANLIVQSTVSASGDTTVPAAQALGNSVSGYYANALVRWYYTNGNAAGLGTIADACVSGGAQADNNCDANAVSNNTVDFSVAVVLNTDITVVIDSSAVTSGWADGTAYADPIFTIDPAYLAAHPSATLLLSDGIGDSATVPEPPNALLFALPLLIVFRRRRTAPPSA